MDIRKLEIVKGDITEEECDAIVNAANTSLLQGGGVCGAIFKKAGSYELQKECNTLAPIKTGEAVITRGYNLKAKFIIHAAGPMYRDDSSSKYLYNAYINSLKKAEENNLKSIAFPSISTGIYGYPLDKAADIALNAFASFDNKSIEKVRIVCFDQHTYDVYKNTYRQIAIKEINDDPIFMLYGAVSYLHELGYEKLRIMSYFSPSGCYFRCEISVKESFDQTGFVIVDYSYPVYKYTTGQEFDFFEERKTYENSSAEIIAKKLFELYPELEKTSKGKDPEYIKWFETVLDYSIKGVSPYAFEDYGYDIYAAKAIRLTNGEYIEYAPM